MRQSSRKKAKIREGWGERGSCPCLPRGEAKKKNVFSLLAADFISSNLLVRSGFAVCQIWRSSCRINSPSFRASENCRKPKEQERTYFKTWRASGRSSRGFSLTGQSFETGPFRSTRGEQLCRPFLQPWKQQLHPADGSHGGSDEDSEVWQKSLIILTHSKCFLVVPAGGSSAGSFWISWRSSRPAVVTWAASFRKLSRPSLRRLLMWAKTTCREPW